MSGDARFPYVPSSSSPAPTVLREHRPASGSGRRSMVRTSSDCGSSVLLAAADDVVSVETDMTHRHYCEVSGTFGHAAALRANASADRQEKAASTQIVQLSSVRVLNMNRIGSTCPSRQRTSSSNRCTGLQHGNSQPAFVDAQEEAGRPIVFGALTLTCCTPPKRRTDTLSIGVPRHPKCSRMRRERDSHMEKLHSPNGDVSSGLQNDNERSGSITTCMPNSRRTYCKRRARPQRTACDRSRGVEGSGSRL